MLSDFYTIKISRTSEVKELMIETRNNLFWNGIKVIFEEENEKEGIFIEYLSYVDISAVAIEYSVRLNFERVLKYCNQLREKLTHVIWTVDNKFVCQDTQVIKDSLFLLENVQVVVKFKLNTFDKSIFNFLKSIIWLKKDVWIEFYNEVNEIFYFTEYRSVFDWCVQHNILFTIKNISPCTIKGYEDLCEYRYSPNVNLNVDDKRFTIPIIDKIFKKYSKCENCRYDNVCAGIPANMSYNEVVFTRCNNNEFSLREALRRQISEKREVDAVVLFSGGLDSKVSALLYAQNNRDKHIALVSFMNSSSLNKYRVEWSGKDIKQRNENIVQHYIINLPDNIYYDAVFNKENIEMGMLLDSNICCSLCKCVMVACACYMCKELFKCDLLITGNNQVVANAKKNPPFPQSKEMLGIYDNIAENYGVRINNIIYEINKRQEVVALGKKMGVSACSSATSLKCPLGLPKPMRQGSKRTLDYVQNYFTEINRRIERETNETIKND